MLVATKHFNTNTKAKYVQSKGVVKKSADKYDIKTAKIISADF